MEYVSASNIRACVKTQSHQLHDLPLFLFHLSIPELREVLPVLQYTYF